MAEYIDDEEGGVELPLPNIGDRKVAACIVDFLVDSLLPFFSEESNRFVYDVCSAADYLDIPILLNVSSKEIARRWKESSVEEIRSLWGFEDDLSIFLKQAIAHESSLLFGNFQHSTLETNTRTQKEWRWPLHILRAILFHLSAPALARVRAVSSVLWDLSKELPACRFATTLLTPTYEWVDASLGFAERYCTLCLKAANHVDILVQLNRQHAVHSLFLITNGKIPPFPLEDLFPHLHSLQRLIMESIYRVFPTRSLDFDLSLFENLLELQYLEIRGEHEIGRKDAEALAALPIFHHLVVNSINTLGPDGAAILATIENLKELEIFQNNDIQTQGVVELSNLKNLRLLILGENNEIDEQGIAELSNLKQLQHLEIKSHNKIGIQGMQAIAKLGDLQFLRIGSSCQITPEAAKALSKLQNLEYLEIGKDNNIGREGVVAISKLKQLQSLIIDDGNIVGENLVPLSTLDKLRRLEIHENKIGAEGVAALSGLKHLQRLVIGFNNCIGAEGAAALSDLKYLQHLVIGCNNCIGAEGAKALSVIQNLESLTIGALNKIGTEGAVALSRLNRLRRLIIGNNNIGTEGAIALSRLKTLSYLVIGNENNIGVEGAIAFSKIKRLKHLEIGDFNSIGSEGVKALFKLSCLKYLWVGFSGNSVNHEAISRLTNRFSLSDR